MLSSTVPSLLGTALALPPIAWGAVRLVGLRVTTVASIALAAAVAIGVIVAELATRASQRAWSGYQLPARLIEGGLRGRTELRAHGLAGHHRARLLAAVENWSRTERRGYLTRALTGWIVPLATLTTAALVAPLAGLAYRDIGVFLSSPNSVRGGLYALSAIPALWGISRGLADGSAAFPVLERI